jgi:hypothetical protein
VTSDVIKLQFRSRRNKRLTFLGDLLRLLVALNHINYMTPETNVSTPE